MPSRGAAQRTLATRTPIRRPLIRLRRASTSRGRSVDARAAARCMHRVAARGMHRVAARGCIALPLGGAAGMLLVETRTDSCVSSRTPETADASATIASSEYPRTRRAARSRAPRICRGACATRSSASSSTSRSSRTSASRFSVGTDRRPRCVQSSAQRREPPRNDPRARSAESETKLGYASCSCDRSARCVDSLSRPGTPARANT